MSDYTEIELGYPNLEWKVSTHMIGKDETYELSDFMADFLYPVVEQFPKFTFKCHGTSYVNNTSGRAIEPRYYEVFFGDEKLGELRTESRRRGRHYMLTTHRIAERRERGSFDATANAATAIKIFRREFRPKNAKELIDRADRTLRGAMQHGDMTTNNDFIRMFERLIYTDRNFIMDNFFDQLVAHARTVRGDADLFDQLPDKYESAKITKEISECAEQENGLLVLLHGSDYVVKSKAGIVTYTPEDLPDWMRRKIGMMKIAEDRMFIKHVGFKSDAKTMYLTIEQEV